MCRRFVFFFIARNEILDTMKNSILLATILVLASVVLIGPMKSSEAKVDEGMCKQMYERYMELGEKSFREKYSTKSYTSDCIKLYKDSTWTFVGKAKIDKNYEKLAALKTAPAQKKVDVSITSAMPIGPERFLVKFRACSNEQSINQPAFLIQSKLEQSLGISTKILHKGKCNDYTSQVAAKQKTDIKIENISDPVQYKNLKSKPI